MSDPNKFQELWEAAEELRAAKERFEKLVAEVKSDSITSSVLASLFDSLGLQPSRGTRGAAPAQSPSSPSPPEPVDVDDSGNTLSEFGNTIEEILLLASNNGVTEEDPLGAALQQLLMETATMTPYQQWKARYWDKLADLFEASFGNPTNLPDWQRKAVLVFMNNRPKIPPA